MGNTRNQSPSQQGNAPLPLVLFIIYSTYPAANYSTSFVDHKEGTKHQQFVSRAEAPGGKYAAGSRAKAESLVLVGLRRRQGKLGLTSHLAVGARLQWYRVWTLLRAVRHKIFRNARTGLDRVGTVWLRFNKFYDLGKS